MNIFGVCSPVTQTLGYSGPFGVVKISKFENCVAKLNWIQLKFNISNQQSQPSWVTNLFQHEHVTGSFKNFLVQDVKKRICRRLFLRLVLRELASFHWLTCTDLFSNGEVADTILGFSNLKSFELRPRFPHAVPNLVAEPNTGAHRSLGQIRLIFSIYLNWSRLL